MKAKIVSVKINSRESEMRLRAGEKGKGQILHSVRYWPWSTPSFDSAYQMICNEADRIGAQIVFAPYND